MDFFRWVYFEGNRAWVEKITNSISLRERPIANQSDFKITKLYCKMCALSAQMETSDGILPKEINNQDVITSWTKYCIHCGQVLPLKCFGLPPINDFLIKPLKKSSIFQVDLLFSDKSVIERITLIDATAPQNPMTYDIKQGFDRVAGVILRSFSEYTGFLEKRNKFINDCELKNKNLLNKSHGKDKA